MDLKSIPSQRQIRFGEVIRSILSESLIRGDFFSTEIDISTITISFVKMSKDLRIASVYIMPLCGKNKNQVLQFLKDNKHIFQKLLFLLSECQKI